MLLIEGTQDLLTPPEPIEELWQLWGQPDIWRLPHGHMSLSLSLGGLTGPVLRWLAPRLDKHAGQERPNDAAQPDGAADSLRDKSNVGGGCPSSVTFTPDRIHQDFRAHTK